MADARKVKDAIDHVTDKRKKEAILTALGSLNAAAIVMPNDPVWVPDRLASRFGDPAVASAVVALNDALNAVDAKVRNEILAGLGGEFLKSLEMNARIR